MLPSSILKEKIEQYKKSLKEPFWEIHEAVYRLCGVTEFEMQRCLDLEDAAKFKRKNYNIGPSCLLNEVETNKNISIEKLRRCILDGLIQAMQNRQITHHQLPLYFRQENEIIKIYAYGNDQANNFPCLRNHTYFLLPYEAIYIAVSPRNMSSYRTTNGKQHLSNSNINASASFKRSNK